MKFLALDTASAQCSVALVMGDAVIVREVATARDHAQLILPMIDEVLAEAGTTLRQLQGIAFGRGPGSFTGVRVAASVTQGLAAGADLPVLPVSDLRALAMQALRRIHPDNPGEGAGFVLACMDARMGEVYWAAYPVAAGVPDSLVAEQVTAPCELIAHCARPCTAAAGLGIAAWPQITDSLQLPGNRVFADAEPHARDVATLARFDLLHGSRWLDAANAQPVYVRNLVATAKSSS